MADTSCTKLEQIADDAFYVQSRPTEEIPIGKPNELNMYVPATEARYLKCTPSLFHFLFEEHGNASFGNSKTDALAFVHRILTEYLDFEQQYAAKVFVGMILDAAVKAGSKDYEIDERLSTIVDMLEKVGVAMIPVSVHDYESHMVCFVLRMRTSDQCTLLEVTLVNTGSGIEYNLHRVYMVSIGIIDDLEDLLLVLMLEEDISEHQLPHTMSEAYEYWTDRLYGRFGMHKLFPLPKKVIPPPRSVTTTAPPEPASSGEEEQQQEEETPSARHFPMSIAQVSGGCTTWASWYAIQYVLANSRIYGTNPLRGIRNRQSRVFAASQRDLDRLTLFGRKLCVMSAIRKAFKCKDNRIARAVVQLLLLSEGGEYSEPDTTMAVYDAGHGTMETVHGCIRRKMAEDPSRLFGQTTKLVHRDRDRTDRMFVIPLERQKEVVKAHEEPSGQLLNITQFYTSPSQPSTFAFAMLHALRCLNDTRFVSDSSNINQTKPVVAAVHVARLRAAAADAAWKCLQCTTEERQIDQSVWMEAVGVPAWIRENGWAGALVLPLDLRQTVCLGLGEASLCLLYCFAASHEKRLQSYHIASSEADIEKHVGFYYKRMSELLRPCWHATLTTRTGDTCFPLSRVYGYINEHLYTILPVYSLSERGQSSTGDAVSLRTTRLPRNDVCVTFISQLVAVCVGGFYRANGHPYGDILVATPTCNADDDYFMDHFAVLRCGRSHNHLRLLDALGSSSATARSIQDMAKGITLDVIQPFYYSSTKPGLYASVHRDTWFERQKTGGSDENVVKDVLLQYQTVARTTTCLRRIDALTDDQAMRVLVAAYQVNPSLLADAAKTRFIAASDALESTGMGRSISAAVRCHLRAVAMCDTKDDSSRRAVYVTANRLLVSTRTMPRMRRGAEDPIWDIVVGTVNALMNFLPSLLQGTDTDEIFLQSLREDEVVTPVQLALDRVAGVLRWKVQRATRVGDFVEVESSDETGRNVVDFVYWIQPRDERIIVTRNESGDGLVARSDRLTSCVARLEIAAKRKEEEKDTTSFVFLPPLRVSGIEQKYIKPRDGGTLALLQPWDEYWAGLIRLRRATAEDKWETEKWEVAHQNYEKDHRYAKTPLELLLSHDRRTKSDTIQTWRMADATGETVVVHDREGGDPIVLTLDSMTTGENKWLLTTTVGGKQLHGVVHMDDPHTASEALYRRWARGIQGCVVVEDAERGRYHVVCMAANHIEALGRRNALIHDTMWHQVRDEEYYGKLVGRTPPNINPVFEIDATGLFILQSPSHDMRKACASAFAFAGDLDGQVSCGVALAGPDERYCRCIRRREAKEHRDESFDLAECVSPEVIEYCRAMASWLKELTEAPTMSCRQDETCTLFAETYRGCGVAKEEDVRHWLLRARKLLSDPESLAVDERLAEQVIEIVTGASATWEAYPHRGDPWPACVADVLAMHPIVMTRWIYRCLFREAVSEAVHRLEALRPVDKGLFDCATLLYALEPVNADVLNLTYVRKLPDVLAELSSGFIARREQFELVQRIEDEDDEYAGIVHQMLMGGGKTSFVMPRLAIGEILRGRLQSSVIAVVPEHLLLQSEVVLARIRGVMGYLDVDMLDRESVEASALPDGRTILERFTATTSRQRPKIDIPVKFEPTNDFVSVVTDKALQLLYLRLVMAKDSTKSAIYGNYFSGLLSERLKNSLIICDEVDLVVDPLSCVLNIPIETGTFNLDVTAIASRVWSNKGKITAAEEAEVASKRSSRPALEDKITRCIAQANDPEMVMDVRYGFGDRPGQQAENYMTAIPYRGARNPSNGSRYVDAELRTVLTIAAYRESMTGESPVFRPVDVAELRRKVQDITDGWRDITPFDSFAIVFGRDMSSRAARAMNDTVVGSITDEQAAVEVTTVLRETQSTTRRRFCASYSTGVADRFSTVYTAQYSVGMLEFLSPMTTRRTAMFSGTINVHTPSPSVGKRVYAALRNSVREKRAGWRSIVGVHPDVATSSLVNAVLSGYICDNVSHVMSVVATKPDVIVVSPTSDKREDVDDAIFRQFFGFSDTQIPTIGVSKRTQYNALIDAAGALHLHDTRHYAERIARAIHEDVLFVDDKGERTVYQVATGTTAACSSMLERPGRPVLFYDQKSTVGVDFVQGSTMRGLVIVDGTTTWTSVAQATFRLRRLSRGHTVDFLLVASSPVSRDIAPMKDPAQRLHLFSENEKRHLKAGKHQAMAAIICAALRASASEPHANQYKSELWVYSQQAKDSHFTVGQAATAIRLHHRKQLAKLIAKVNKSGSKIPSEAGDELCNVYAKHAAFGTDAAATASQLQLLQAQTQIRTQQHTSSQSQNVNVDLVSREIDMTFDTALDPQFLVDAYSAFSPGVSAFALLLNAIFKNVFVCVGALHELACMVERISQTRLTTTTPPMTSVVVEHLTGPTFAVAEFELRRPTEPRTVFVCNDADVIAASHAPTKPGICRIIYSTTGEPIWGTTNAPPALRTSMERVGDAAFPRAMRLWCLRHTLTEDENTKPKRAMVVALMKRSDVHPNIVEMYRSKADGMRRAVASLRRFAEAPFAFSSPSTTTSHELVGCGHSDDIATCASCGGPATYRCPCCLREFCSRECQRRFQHHKKS